MGGKPNYAVVKLPLGCDTVELYTLLVQHGYSEVSFVEKLFDVPIPSTPERTPKSSAALKRFLNEGSAVCPCPPSFSPPPKLKKAVCKLTKEKSANNDLPEMLVIKSENVENEASSSTPSETTDFAESPKATACVSEKTFDSTEQILMELNNSLCCDPTISIPQKPKKEKPDSSQAEEVPVPCMKCNAKLKVSRMHCVRYHLAMHYSEKQFRCSKCSHGSHLNGNVKLHIRSNHPDGANIIEVITDEMVDGWCELAVECFPHMAEKVIQLLRQRHSERRKMKHKEEIVDAINPSISRFVQNYIDSHSILDTEFDLACT